NVKMPSLKEQFLVGNVFSNIDSLITLHQRKLEKLKNIKNMLLEKMFADEKTLKPAIRFKEFTNDWEQRRLGDVGSSVSGISLEKHLVNNSIYKFVSIGSFSENSEYVDQNLRIELNSNTKPYLLNENDLVMILNDKTQYCNILGRVLKIGKNGKFIHNQRTQRIIPDKNIFDPSYLYFLLNSFNFRRKIIQNSQGNTQVYINWKTIKTINLAYSNHISEQIKISSIFTFIDTLITLHQRNVFYLFFPFFT
ncbi:restriction endonuclease subunit S, partial [Mycoplasma tauri]|uniref:restriction endonuclease subunit S n=1 Tax=Mycoplasma tauri TaxID=547987 RepID=UPI001CC16CBA